MKRVRIAAILAMGSWTGTIVADELGWRAQPSSPSGPITPVQIEPVKPDQPGWHPARATPGTPASASPTPPPSLFTPPAQPLPAAPPEWLFKKPDTPQQEPPATGLFLKPKALEPLPGSIIPTSTSSRSRAEVLPAVEKSPFAPFIQIPRIATSEPVPPTIPAIPSPPQPLADPSGAGVPTPALQLPDPTPKTLPLVPGLGIPYEPNQAKEPTEPKAEPKVEPLPPPRRLPDPMNATPDKPKSPEAPASGGPLAPAGGPILEPLPGLNLGDTSIPSRGRVFGSNSITISRDTAYRDAVGVDLLSESTAGRLFGRDEVNGPPSWSSFFQAEYLLWWTNRQEIPVLASTGTETSAGYLGNAGTRTLLGPGQFGPSFRDGLRVRLGSYFDDCSGLGYDATFFFLGRRSESFAADPSQFPIITRPFFNQNSGTEFGEQVSFPELARGRLEIDADSFIWGGDINLRKALCRTCQGGYGWFAGYRHLNMTENLNMTEFITASGPLALPDPVGTRVVVGDRFRTENQFHGAQVGGFWQHRYGRLDIDGRASLAMGVTHQVVTVSGFQERTRPGEATQSFRGGLLAVGTNIGRFTSDRFSVVPEATVNVGYLIAPGVRTYVGYNFLYWSNVVRPGDQIDRTIDVTLIPNPPRGALPVGRDRPRIPFKQSDFWATGLQFGLEFRW